MKTVLNILIATILTFTVSSASFAGSCFVNDPTGTPLNVRETPGGTIKAKLMNGFQVDIMDTVYDSNGKPWVKIHGKLNDKWQTIGWVYKNYLQCGPSDASKECKVNDPTGTKLNVRKTIGGKVVWTLGNDEYVFIEKIKTDKKGNKWAYVGQEHGDGYGILGWVFYNYLNCK